jgi:hypothetical protein
MKRRAAIYIFLVPALFTGTASARFTREIPDTIKAASSESLDSLQNQMERNSFGRYLSDYVFVTKMDTASVGRGAVKSESPFVPYVGRFIRHIEIYRYDIFSDTEAGADNSGSPALIRALEWIHLDTKISKIARFLLFEEGDPVNPFALSDSERLLRETSFIQDARVKIVPVEGIPDSVDVLVLTRDVWSIGAGYTWITEDRHRVKVYERNLLGYGQTIQWEGSIDLPRDRKIDHSVYYGAPNIYGSFIDGSIRWTDAVAYKYNEWALRRGFVSPEIKWTGAASIEGMDDYDEIPEKIRKWDRQDLWLGRSFRIGTGYTEEGSRMSIIPAVRATRTDYHVRPPVGPDLNIGYHDKVTYLASLSLTQRSFRKMRMVFSFGRTEDVPYGMLASVTSGPSVSEFFTRPYLAFDLAYARFIGSSGYIAARGAVGSYTRDGSTEDGTLSLTVGGFTSLIPAWRAMGRHFLTIDYIHGYDRRPGNDIDLEYPRGELRGLSNTGVEGHERLVIRWEGVLFADWDWYGFRFASFGYAQAGQCGPDWNSFLDAKYYFSLGGGLRVHNERLIFDAYEIRFMYHPVVPEGADTQWFRFEAVRNINIPFLSPGAPRVIKYE